MCGRFTLTMPTFAELSDALGLTPDPDMEEVYKPRFNVAPTDACFIVRARRGVAEGAQPAPADREIVMADWGLVPYFSASPREARRPINARAETIATSPLFRDAFARKRCVVVADGYFEWARQGKTKTPYWIHPEDGGLMLMAGVHDSWTDRASRIRVRTFAIVTTQPNATVAGIHDRMPVVLSEADVGAWLRVPRTDRHEPPADLKELLVPAPDGLLALRRVSSRVGSTKNDDPALLEPV
jgi:putative SOS response-associated peptidase YedK